MTTLFFFSLSLCSEDNVKVVATVIEHTRLKKVVVFKKKRRKNYKRTKGIEYNQLRFVLLKCN